MATNNHHTNPGGKKFGATMRNNSRSQDWNALRLSVASPERILEWSRGEITKPETINYRTQRSEKHGLFDEKIFGPERDYECYCGKYKGIRYKGIICDKCGVEITRSIVRRERMGHIELVTPVAHIWFLRSMPSRMATVMGVPSADLEKVIYFAGYIVTKVNEETKKRLLSELEAEYKTKLNVLQAGVKLSNEERKAIEEGYQEYTRTKEFPKGFLNEHDRDLSRIYAKGMEKHGKEFPELYFDLTEARSKNNELKSRDPEIAGDIEKSWEKLLINLSSPGVDAKFVKECKQSLYKTLRFEKFLKDKDIPTRSIEALKERMTLAKSEIDSVTVGHVFDEISYHRFSVKYGTLFEAKIGAEAIYDIFKNLDLVKLKATLEERYPKAGAAEREKLAKRISLISNMLAAGTRPEWMFLTKIPVIPPALRPMVALEGGRHATSDLNDLYRRVINRNNRLKKLLDIKAPEVILRNEKRILQEAVDALLDNSIRKSGASGGALTPAQRRPLKSLADYLKGKQGYFRQNLLGKRVDYSGRSVIVVGPDLELDECGIPKHMALELFRPFVIAGLLDRELAFNIRGAGRLIEDGVPEVWEILEEAIEGKYVLLNRAPTLHRQGIQAFRPTLIEGDAIQLHPLVCPAFNADFDGDQMAIHVPLSEEAQWEAQNVMSANKNILKPGSGLPVIATSHDIALGCYWLTKIVEGAKGEGKYFASPNAAILAHEYGQVDLRALVHIKPTEERKAKYESFDGKIFETTVGRLLFNTVLPSDYPYVNDAITKKVFGAIINDCIVKYGLDRIPKIVNKIKRFGFEYATKSGITWSLDDMIVPAEKAAVVNDARAQVAKLEASYQNGLLSEEEKRRLVIEIWHGTKTKVEELVEENLNKNPVGSVNDIIRSGARGSIGNLTQMTGMKGLIQNTAGETIEVPIVSSMIEGMNPVEYFMSTHGARKGLTDTALGTARAGYLTRRLFDVAQDSIITEKDCGTKRGIAINRVSASGLQIDFGSAIRGRTLSAEVTANGTVVKKNHYLTAEDARVIDADATVTTVSVRSPMSCETRYGICAACYGMDLTSQEIIDLGEAVGTVAAQAIGEPGTQLTMRTFHAGGTASVGGDITQGLPRVEEVFEKRSPKNPAIVSKFDGIVTEIREEGRDRVIVVQPEVGQGKKDGSATEFAVHFPRQVLIKEGDTVTRGQFLTDGSADLDELFEYAGRAAVQEYIIAETSKIYELQGASVSRKHLEVIVKQMFSFVKIVDTGDSEYSVGDVVEHLDFGEIVKNIEAEGKIAPKAKEMVLGIKTSALSRRSFLSAASFEQTTKILIDAALRGSVDTLRGLKENVILGRLIPAGTGFAESKKGMAIAKIQAARRVRQAEALERIEEEAARPTGVAVDTTA